MSNVKIEAVEPAAVSSGHGPLPGSDAQECMISDTVPLSDVSTTEAEDSSINDSPEKGQQREGRSSISVIFKNWIPADNSDSSEAEFTGGPSSFAPPSRHNNRYFHVQRGNVKFRPGLGSNPEEFVAKLKAKKRKKPPMELIIDAENMAKRFKITSDRPASAILNELSPDLVFSFETGSTEPSKPSPSFKCSVTFPPFSDTQFVGEGRSKKLAKNDVAEKILASLGLAISPKDTPVAQDKQQMDVDLTIEPFSVTGTGGPSFKNMNVQYQYMQTEIDFSSDDIINENFVTPVATPAVLSQPMVDSNTVRRLQNIPNFEDNACLVLNTILFPSTIEYENLGEEGPPHDRKFTVKISFGDQEYIGYGGSKKKARADAAKQAVITLLGESCYNSLAMSSPKMESASTTVSSKPKRKQLKKEGVAQLTPTSVENVSIEGDDEDDDDDDWGEYDLNFSDHISNSVREKYEELMGKDANYSPYKVLAGVVMTVGSPMIYNSSVIAVTTGTKCVEGDCMSEQGLAVNDCHAEILSTRCVRDFIYSQIENYQQEKTDCIIEQNASDNGQHKFRLKPDVKFHLFISTSPCGDARIFSPKGIELDDDQPSPTGLEDTHPNKLNRGVLRSKIEAGEGTIPSTNLYKGPQTWDSIISGNALYTMSCSDKVCRWNVVGLQGALLYNLIGAVYYSSITLGSLHHPVHFKRAVYGRIETLNSRLEIPFFVNKPKLLMVSREEKRKVKKSPNHAVCWSTSWSTPEIIAASKGTCEPGGVPSRLTKRMAFARFLKLYNNNSGGRDEYADLTYHEAKLLATEYQKAKDEFVGFFQEAKLGPWIGKPVEQDSFKIK
ncbi:Double-stranded RNA-specific editase 1 [Orchesella cincta]|uniref:Double-stranded RNA-specific editase 1 n=1 Tax=Orchesella cincta TaxID=48709 RepID=A0A1D2MQU8_ORCCI|nr:Double-stranded RNA-specific editase 1 [Orchesella cincta]